MEAYRNVAKRRITMRMLKQWGSDLTVYEKVYGKLCIALGVLAGLVLVGGVLFGPSFGDGANADGGDREAHAGVKVFDANYRVEVEPIEVVRHEEFIPLIHRGEASEIRLTIKNHSPAIDWVVAMEAKFDFSRPELHQPGVGVEVIISQGSTAVIYHLGDPIVIPAGASTDIVIAVRARDGAGTVWIENVSIYRLRPFVDGLG